jgi:hypothetical protein
VCTLISDRARRLPSASDPVEKSTVSSSTTPHTGRVCGVPFGLVVAIQ